MAVRPVRQQASEITEELCKVTLKGNPVRQGWVIDILNGTEQELVLSKRGEDTIIDGVRVKNYPTLFRFTA